jgi:hypothetical protein
VRKFTWIPTVGVQEYVRLTYLLAGVAPVAFLLGLVVNAQILRVQRGQDAVAALKKKQDKKQKNRTKTRNLCRMQFE